MRKRPWLRRFLAALVIVVALSAGFSRSLRTGPVHGYLTARLEAAFGRPVEVGKYRFSLLNGLRLEAEYVTVAEDPRFGYEYFLRAERLTTGLRWTSLLRGRFEFGTLSFTRPSLNLVRAADGHWNVESWLPPPARPASSAAPAFGPAAVPARLYRIEISGGRINFKLGLDKHPFALTNLSGRLEQENPGRWLMDLEGRPSRAAVTLQEAGTLRLRGRIAGTSSRLQPAELALTWHGVSLADALRLARGQDYGVWGRIMVEVTARTEAPGTSPQGDAGSAESHTVPAAGTRWRLNAALRLLDLHRWDLPHRAGDPALNVICEAELPVSAPSSGAPGPAIELSKCTIEAPLSNATAKGILRWHPGFDPELHISSDGIAWGDVLAWYRALRLGVAENLTLDGHIGLNLSARGWPPRLEGGALTSGGARVSGGGLRAPLRLESVEARVRRGRLALAPTVLAFGAPSVAPASTAVRAVRATRAGPVEALHLEAALGPPGGAASTSFGAWTFELALDGQTNHAEDWLAAARALGYLPFGEWSIEGPAALRLRWQGNLRLFGAQPAGTMELRGVRLRPNYINQSITQVQAHLEIEAASRRVTLAGAQAFGGRWKGTLRRTEVPAAAGLVSPATWEFDLAADRLDANELDRWLGPRARAGLFARLMPFAVAPPDTTNRDAALARLRARGRLSVDDVTLGRLELKRLRANVELTGRSIRVRGAEAEFYKGSVRGELVAELAAQPVYRFTGTFDRVNLALLADATAALRGHFAGAFAGSLALDAQGVGRDDLLRSLKGRGALQFRGVKLHGLDLRESHRAASARDGSSEFAEAAANFTISSRKIQVETLQMTSAQGAFLAQGTVDFSRVVDLRVRPLAANSPPASGGDTADSRSLAPAAARTVRVVGSLDALQVTPVEAEAGKAGAKKK